MISRDFEALTFSFKEIIVENEVRDSELTRKVLRAFPDLPVQWVDHEPPASASISITQTKKILYLTRFRGELIKPCPGTRDYICCGYRILHFGSNCPIHCSYCILQAYFNQPFIRLFANTEELFSRLEAFVGQQEGKILRLGTGEFTDSLALDPITGFSTLLLERLSAYPKVVLELKTKTAAVANLLRHRPLKNIILSWSLNPSEIVSREETGAATLSERLKAASACQEQGYLLGFHFDPLFYFPGWEKAYYRTVENLFARIKPERIAWISLGCFRFMPALKPIIRERSPKSQYIYEEFIPALDKKMRYVQPIRVQIYRHMLQWIKGHGEDIPVYLCMENPAVWDKVFGFIPGENGPTLTEMLDQRLEDRLK